MAPKKKQQKQKTSSSSSSSKGKPVPSTGPKLQLSAENESRLRRLLINTGRPLASLEPAEDTLSKEKKAKRLRSIYEKLSCDGFKDNQIELALSSLTEKATYESALDWLCLNVPGDELPLRFTSGTSLHTSRGSVGVISTAREDWVSSRDSLEMKANETVEFTVKIKGQKDDETLESFQHSQANWIRQYMELHGEDDSDSWETDLVDSGFSKKVLEPRRDYESIADEYNAARLEGIKAKQRGDKKGQEGAGLVIRKLKEEILALGLSVDVLESGFGSSYNCTSVDALSDSAPSHDFHDTVVAKCDVNAAALSTVFGTEGVVNSGSLEYSIDNVTLGVPTQDEATSERDLGDVELGSFFLENDSSEEVLPHEVLEIQRKENMKELCSGKNMEKMEGIWKKGDPPKIPKAVLQQLCQRSGWEAPKYEKILGTGHTYGYSVSILRKASGRGKSRKAGGLTTVRLPSQEENFNTPEDAQNRVAAYALHCLFPYLPVHLALLEPYASVVLKLKEGDMWGKEKYNQEDRRSDFVDALLSGGDVNSITKNDASSSAFYEKIQMPHIVEDITGDGMSINKLAESLHLKKEQESKKETMKYKEMLKSRLGLPIAELRGDILHLLEENDVLVISGETGCGKTTQVPQYILDDMIEAGLGGFCNVICTQPRRIAAISVAERVADERCESSPGSKDCLVGYQVRLDSARTERTRLLFCTTGILLRILSGNKNLSGITHVIVDEVHERSLLGDFLLIILKNLIEKQRANGNSKLKVILMSATVDSHMFSHYFGDCPVVSAQGRTHPVSTQFLEDIYENLNYHLASDSLASIYYGISAKEKQSAPVGIKRGKKNLVLSGWGDDSLLSKKRINPYYIQSNYLNYSEKTHKNLRNLNEGIIDYDLLEDLVCHVDTTYAEGAILVFLPGVAEINILLEKLAASRQFGGISSEWLLPVHSSIAPEDQKKVFQKPPDGIRKVIIATNIAETSITIDDVVYVVDCGRHKENRYNPQKKLSSMVEDWISQANARQRQGRAGRVKPGICFCLYTHHRYEKLMRPYQIPEMMRMPLVELCLQVKLLLLGDIKQFLLGALEPPSEEAIAAAVSSLYEVGAIEGNEELTPLGHHLAKLPVDVLIGKMMIYGGIFGCLSPILTISAFLSYKSPFVHPRDERENVDRTKLSLLTDKIGGTAVPVEGVQHSDHLVMLIAYQKWDKILNEHGVKAAQKFCSMHFLSSSVMYMIRDMRIQLGTLLADIGMINIPKNYQFGWKKKEKLDGWLSDLSQSFNQHSSNLAVVKAIICAGLYPNVAKMEGGNVEGRPVWYDGRREVCIHPSSVNRNQKAFRYPFLVFLEKTGRIIVDNWLTIEAPAQTAVLFKELRITLHSILKELISKPQNMSVADNEVMRSIIHLFLEEDKPIR